MHQDRFKSFINTTGIWLSMTEFQSLLNEHIQCQKTIDLILQSRQNKKHILVTEAKEIIRKYTGKEI